MKKKKSTNKFGYRAFERELTSLQEKKLKKAGFTNQEILQCTVIYFDYSSVKVASKKEWLDLKRPEKKLNRHGKAIRVNEMFSKQTIGLDKAISATRREKLIQRLSLLNDKKYVCFQRIECKHQVYAFRLSNDVWNESKFRKCNPKVPKDSKPNFCYYVGSTSKDLVERYNQHIGSALSKTGKDLRVSITRKYLLKPFSEADASTLLHSTNKKVTRLSEAEALTKEKVLGESLKSQTVATYYGL